MRIWPLILVSFFVLLLLFQITGYGFCHIIGNFIVLDGYKDIDVWMIIFLQE